MRRSQTLTGNRVSAQLAVRASAPLIEDGGWRMEDGNASQSILHPPSSILRPSRAGYTLVELVVSMTSATMLMIGLASAMVIAGSAFRFDSSSQAEQAAAAAVQADLAADLNHALAFTERTDKAVTFAVPDRNGNGLPETIRYAWSGTPGDPLTYSYNGQAPVNLADDVQSFRLNYVTRAAYPVYEEFTEAKRPSGGAAIAVPRPPGTSAGDLLIAAIATNGDTKDAITAPADWKLIVVEERSSAVTLAVWWKIAAASEPGSYAFQWAANQQSYAWIMRFTGHNAAAPIHAWAFATTGSGATRSPLSPAVTTSVSRTLILRLGAFDDDNINIDLPGLPDHAAITMDKSNFGDGTVSGGAGYATQTKAGGSGTSRFSLTDEGEAVTVTIAIAPTQ